MEGRVFILLLLIFSCVATTKLRDWKNETEVWRHNFHVEQKLEEVTRAKIAPHWDELRKRGEFASFSDSNVIFNFQDCYHLDQVYILNLKSNLNPVLMIQTKNWTNFVPFLEFNPNQPTNDQNFQHKLSLLKTSLSFSDNPLSSNSINQFYLAEFKDCGGQDYHFQVFIPSGSDSTSSSNDSALLSQPRRHVVEDRCPGCDTNLNNTHHPQSTHYYVSSAKLPASIPESGTIQIEIKPFPWVIDTFSRSYTKIGFVVLMSKEGTVQPIGYYHKFNFSSQSFGPISITAIDPGTYELTVKAVTVLGTDLWDIELPIIISSHQKYVYRKMNDMKSQVQNSRIILNFEGDEGALMEPENANKIPKCTSANIPGRWINHDPALPCIKPLCTGPRNSSTHAAKDWNGVDRPYIWVPKGCYYHYYTTQDMIHCIAQNQGKANNRNQFWVHVVGDSPIREIAGNIRRVFNQFDGSKFHAMDVCLAQDGTDIVRDASALTSTPCMHVSFLFPDQMMTYMGRKKPFRNWTRDEIDADLFQLNTEKQNAKAGRPDILAYNSALAYCTLHMRHRGYMRWLEEAEQYWSKADKGVRKTWVRYPFTYGQGHTGNDWISAERVVRFNEESEKVFVDNLGWELVDFMTPTLGIPEASWDGLHYGRGGNGEWQGTVSFQMTHMFLNMAFGDCEGVPD